MSPSLPRAETGIYWGYTVRVAPSLSDIFTQSPYDSGYDLTVGTSDKGANVHGLASQSLRYNHALIVFGGVQGLEAALENDDRLTVDDPSLLFDEYVNIAPAQGSRTIRTEEAILIALAGLEGKLDPVQRAKEFDMVDAIAQSDETGVRHTGVKQFEPRRKKQTKTEPAGGEAASSEVEQAVPTGNGGDFSRFD